MIADDYWARLLIHADSFRSGQLSFGHCLELMEEETGPDRKAMMEARHAIEYMRRLEYMSPGFFTRSPKRGDIAIRMLVWVKTGAEAQERQRPEQRLADFGSSPAVGSELKARAELVAELQGMGYFRHVSPGRLNEFRAAAISGQPLGERDSQIGYDPLIGLESGRSVMIDAENIAEGFASDVLAELRPYLADLGVDLGDIDVASRDDGEQTLTIGGASYLLSTADDTDQNDWYPPTWRALSAVNALMKSRGTEERVYLLNMGELSLAVFMTPGMYLAIADSDVFIFPELESVEDTPEGTDD